MTTKTKPTLHDLTKPDGRRYYNEPFGVARSIPKGRVLAHNHVQHALYMGHGINGFCCSTNLADEAMRLFAQRAKDPSHRWHHRLKWRDGRPILPKSDEQLAEITAAALNEPKN